MGVKKKKGLTEENLHTLTGSLPDVRCGTLACSRAEGPTDTHTPGLAQFEILIWVQASDGGRQSVSSLRNFSASSYLPD